MKILEIVMKNNPLVNINHFTVYNILGKYISSVHFLKNALVYFYTYLLLQILKSHSFYYLKHLFRRQMRCSFLAFVSS